MSSLFERHPEQELVGYLDGELSGRRTRKVASHLEACGRCRAELDELRNSLAECVTYRDAVAQITAPAPKPWRDLSRDFSRIDESLANTSLLGWLLSPLVHSGVPRWAFSAGLAGLIVLLSLNQLRQAPSVQAASLLRKAVAVSQSKPHAAAHRIRVRSSHQPEFTRIADVQAALVEVAQAQAVAALFQKANWDWNAPLSARAFEQWRDQQVHKTDEVTAVKNPQVPSEHLIQIRTTSPDGELEAASITLDTDNYAAVSERLEFRDSEWVELSDIAETSTENAGYGVAHVEAPVRAAEPPSRPAAFAPGPSASISDELRVLSALSGIEADLGDPVEVNLTGGKVVVRGDGVAPHRQEVIRAALANHPNVEVDFSAHASAVPAQAAVVSGSASSAGSPMEARLEKHLGGHAEFDRFSTQLQDLLDGSMKRVYALHNLAQKFSPQDESHLSSQDISLLHELSRKHAADLADRLTGMEKILMPTLSSLGGSAASVHSAAHANWQMAANDALHSAQHLDELVSRLLGLTAGNTAPSDLMSALNELRANVDDCQKTLK